MFCCCVCGDKFPKISVLRVHLQARNRLGELRIHVQCLQHDCTSSFTRVFNFVRHLTKYHEEDEMSGDTVKSVSSCVDVGVVDDEFGVQPMHSTSDKACLQSEGCALVASLRASSGVPYSIIPNIVDSFDSMLGMSIHSETIKVLAESGVGADVLSNVKCALQRQSDTLSHPLDMA